MNTTERTARTLRWAARITGTALLAFLLFMLIGHLTGDANGPTGMAFRSASDVVGFMLFPVITIIGLALAYKWESAGGAMAAGSILALLVLRPGLLGSAFPALLIPALLYVLAGRLRKHAVLRRQVQDRA